jgi:hypothetical protein
VFCLNIFAKFVLHLVDLVLQSGVVRPTLNLLFVLSSNFFLELVVFVLLFLDLGFHLSFILFNLLNLLLQLLNSLLAFVNTVVDLAGLFLSLHVHLTQLVLLFTEGLAVLDLVFKELLKLGVLLLSLLNGHFAFLER